MRRVTLLFIGALVVTLLFIGALVLYLPLRDCRAGTGATGEGPEAWSFAVSGDSRNCGNVVMPEIAAGALKDKAQFYWHLGDFRAIYKMDEDFASHELYREQNASGRLTFSTYLLLAWPDFIEHQIRPFGSLPVFLGIGNHETITPKSREEYLVQFSAWLNAGPVQRQRAAAPDYRWDWKTTTYYHWKWKNVDFINLDNATGDQFDDAQLNWFETVLAWDAAKDSDVKTIVVGMHKALPDSLSDDHSMSETATGSKSGRRVYEDLLKMRDGTYLDEAAKAAEKKNIYVLASHSHYYMKDIYRTPYWKNFWKYHVGAEDAGVLEGWIVGTAGAERSKPPEEQVTAKKAIAHTYGYLVGAVTPDSKITFEFKAIGKGHVTSTVRQSYSEDFVNWCFDKNPPPLGKN